MPGRPDVKSLKCCYCGWQAVADPGAATTASPVLAPAPTPGQASGAGSGQACVRPAAAPTIPDAVDERLPLQPLPPPDGKPASPLAPPAVNKRKRDTAFVLGTVSCRLHIAYVLAL